MPKYAIVHTEDAPKWETGWALWQDAMKEEGEEWVVYHAATNGEVPSIDDDLDGVIITGSVRGGEDAQGRQGLDMQRCTALGGGGARRNSHIPLPRQQPCAAFL
jgi:hypothetical protein